MWRKQVTMHDDLTVHTRMVSFAQRFENLSNRMHSSLDCPRKTETSYLALVLLTVKTNLNFPSCSDTTSSNVIRHHIICFIIANAREGHHP